MKKKILFYAGLILILVFFFFLPSFSNGFVNWDDPYDFWKNPLIKDFSWRGIHSIFEVVWRGQYNRFMPLTLALFSAEFHFFGLNPFGYHCVSAFLHSLDSLEVFILIYILTAQAGVAFASALLFGLHPLHMEPVVWASAGAYPSGAFFFLGSIIFYLWGIHRASQKAEFHLLSFISFFLAYLFNSGMTMPLPFILLAMDYYYEGKISKGQVLWKAPFFLLTFYFGWLTLKAAHHGTDGLVPSFLAHQHTLFFRLILSGEAMGMYLHKFFIPYPLSCLYPTGYYFHRAFWSGPLMGGVVLFLFVFFHQRAGLRISFLGLLWFLLTLAPYLHIHGVSESLIYDRYLYIPSIGILLMLIGIWNSLKSQKGVGRIPLNFYLKAVFLSWLIIIISLSYQQMGVWRDGGTLWTNFLTQYSRFPDGYLNRSDYYLTIKKPLLALRDTNILLKLSPQDARAYQNQGIALYQLRQKEIEAKKNE